jgi:hypothetical protein
MSSETRTLEIKMFTQLSNTQLRLTYKAIDVSHATARTERSADEHTSLMIELFAEADARGIDLS